MEVELGEAVITQEKTTGVGEGHGRIPVQEVLLTELSKVCL